MRMRMRDSASLRKGRKSRVNFLARNAGTTQEKDAHAVVKALKVRMKQGGITPMLNTHHLPLGHRRQ